jgi:hypothetical protein
LTSNADVTKMANVQMTVRRRMKELGWGPYDLAKAVKGKVSAPTIYNFVKRGSAINAKSLGSVLDALGLEIRSKE